MSSHKWPPPTAPEEPKVVSLEELQAAGFDIAEITPEWDFLGPWTPSQAGRGKVVPNDDKEELEQ